VAAGHDLHVAQIDLDIEMLLLRVQQVVERVQRAHEAVEVHELGVVARDGEDRIRMQGQVVEFAARLERGGMPMQRARPADIDRRVSRIERDACIAGDRTFGRCMKWIVEAQEGALIAVTGVEVADEIGQWHNEAPFRSRRRSALKVVCLNSSAVFHACERLCSHMLISGTWSKHIR
jgi:hypothetical protein